MYVVWHGWVGACASLSVILYEANVLQFKVVNINGVTMEISHSINILFTKIINLGDKMFIVVLQNEYSLIGQKGLQKRISK